MPRLIVAFAAIGFILTISSCANNSADSNLAKGKELFYANDITAAKQTLLDAHTQDPDNTEITCYLAEASRRLSDLDGAIAYAREVLSRDDCNAFAHTVIASAYEPMWSASDQTSSDSCWNHALAAVECDPEDGNAWLVVWTQALRRGDTEKEKQALAALLENSFFSGPILEYNRWVLETVPHNAILLTNGDLDTYPAVAIQSANSIRPDVAIVNLSLLNTDWYEEYLQTRYGLNLPLPEATQDGVKGQMEGDTFVTPAMLRVSGWIRQLESGELTNPFAIATTVYQDNLPKDLRGRLRFVGSYFELDSFSDSIGSTDKLILCFNAADLTAYKLPSVSDMDRSPVRRKSGNFGARNICEVGIRLCEALRDEKKTDQAIRYFETVKEFAAQAGLEEQLSKKIRQLEVDLRG